MYVRRVTRVVVITTTDDHLRKILNGYIRPTDGLEPSSVALFFRSIPLTLQCVCSTENGWRGAAKQFRHSLKTSPHVEAFETRGAGPLPGRNTLVAQVVHAMVTFGTLQRRGSPSDWLITVHLAPRKRSWIFPRLRDVMIMTQCGACLCHGANVGRKPYAFPLFHLDHVFCHTDTLANSIFFPNPFRKEKPPAFEPILYRASSHPPTLMDYSSWAWIGRGNAADTSTHTHTHYSQTWTMPTSW